MDRVLMQYFEWYLPDDGAHWRRLAADAQHLKEAGFTDIWMPPACKGANGMHDVGYGVYDTYDLGEFDQKGSVPTKYGTKDEYLQAVEALHRAGLRAVADIVLNHRMGADGCENVKAEAVAETNRNHVIDEENISAWTEFHFPGRKQKYSDFCWNHTHFSGVDWDDRAKRHQIYQLDGKDWNNEVDRENGNYDYLMGADLDMSNPEVLEELDRWGEWYLQTTGVDGLRLDAVKHIQFTFFTDWLAKLRQKTGKELWTVGEYWSPDLSLLLHYTETSGAVMSLFDVPLHFHFAQASVGNGNYDMSRIFDGTLVKERPELAVTFVDNHDTQPGQALQSWVLPWFKPLAYAMILLRCEGTPCVFYGDYYGILHDHIAPVGEPLSFMLGLRPKLAGTAQHDYFDDSSVVGWTRTPKDGGNGICCAVLLTDSVSGSKRMFVGGQFAGCVFADALHNRPEKIVIDQEGYGLFTAEGGSVSVWMEENGEKTGTAEAM